MADEASALLSKIPEFVVSGLVTALSAGLMLRAEQALVMECALNLNGAQCLAVLAIDGGYEVPDPDSLLAVAIQMSAALAWSY